MLQPEASDFHPEKTGINVSAFHRGFDDRQVWKTFKEEFFVSSLWGGEGSNFTPWADASVPDALHEITLTVKAVLERLT